MKDTIFKEVKRVVNPSLYNIYQLKDKNWQVTFAWEPTKSFDGFPSYKKAKEFAVDQTIKMCPIHFKNFLWVEF